MKPTCGVDKTLMLGFFQLYWTVFVHFFWLKENLFLTTCLFHNINIHYSFSHGVRLQFFPFNQDPIPYIILY